MALATEPAAGMRRPVSVSPASVNAAGCDGAARTLYADTLLRPTDRCMSDRPASRRRYGKSRKSAAAAEWRTPHQVDSPVFTSTARRMSLADHRANPWWSKRRTSKLRREKASLARIRRSFRFCTIKPHSQNCEGTGSFGPARSAEGIKEEAPRPRAVNVRRRGELVTPWLWLMWAGGFRSSLCALLRFGLG